MSVGDLAVLYNVLWCGPIDPSDSVSFVVKVWSTHPCSTDLSSFLISPLLFIPPTHTEPQCQMYWPPIPLCSVEAKSNILFTFWYELTLHIWWSEKACISGGGPSNSKTWNILFLVITLIATEDAWWPLWILKSREKAIVFLHGCTSAHLVAWVTLQLFDLDSYIWEASSER